MKKAITKSAYICVRQFEIPTGLRNTYNQDSPLLLSALELAHILDAQYIGNEPEALLDIIELGYDSRQVARPAETLFFCLRGQQTDGHKFIPQLIDQGVKCFVVEESFLNAIPENAPNEKQLSIVNCQLSIDQTHFFVTKTNALQAMQKLATHKRQQFKGRVIGITGSNGKTTVKEWLYQCLSPNMKVMRSPKSYNSQLGVALSVWQLSNDFEVAILEAGISKKGEMETLESMIKPHIGVFTNLGEAHAEGFDSFEEKGLEKAKLFKNSEWLICNSNLPKEVQAAFGTNTKLIFPKNSPELAQLPFMDSASLENAATCAAVMEHLGIHSSLIWERLATLKPLSLRLEVKKALNNCTLVDDSYSADLTSLRVALDFLKQQSGNRAKTAILSDFLESNLPKIQLFGSIIKLLSEKGVQRLIAIGHDWSEFLQAHQTDLQAEIHLTTEAFLAQFAPVQFHEEAILIKGARSFGFERIARRLEMKLHRTVLEINLTALVQNLGVYRGVLKGKAKLMCMVKASGYGSGSAEVARLLEYHGVDYLGVAYADEGVELREAGIKLPILVLNPEESSFDTMRRYGLEPEIYSFRMLEAWLSNWTSEHPPIHLKLDTGMKRLGFEPHEITELCTLLQSAPQLRIQSIFTHLVASDAAEHDEFTHQQLSLFDDGYQQICAATRQQPMRHVLNSGGIPRFPEWHFEMVRLGIGLYGIDGSGIVQQRLRPISALRTTISQIKKIKAGETVGYNRRGKTEYNATIATIGIGYADGFPRALGNGNVEVLVRGQRCRSIGNVCMDMTMIDVTHLPHVAEGDEVEIFGEQLSVQLLAERLGTISYEALTMVSERVRRVVFQE